ncbi:MAG: LuxR C-terminal-related transcriptional regulator [Rhizobacter sp.]
MLTYLSKGFTIKEIANLMGIKWFTVNDHIKSIYKKLNVSSRATASSARAHRHGRSSRRRARCRSLARQGSRSRWGYCDRARCCSGRSGGPGRCFRLPQPAARRRQTRPCLLASTAASARLETLSFL